MHRIVGQISVHRRNVCVAKTYYMTDRVPNVCGEDICIT